MAHYKRKRPRGSAGGHYSNNALKYRLGDRFDSRIWLRNYPRWWDKCFHTRPSRTKTRRLENRVLRGEDPDNMTWPDGRKPHIYYW